MNVKSAMLGVVIGVLAAGFVPSVTSVAHASEGQSLKPLADGEDCNYPITDPRFWLCNPR